MSQFNNEEDDSKDVTTWGEDRWARYTGVPKNSKLIPYNVTLVTRTQLTSFVDRFSSEPKVLIRVENVTPGEGRVVVLGFHVPTFSKTGVIIYRSPYSFFMSTSFQTLRTLVFDEIFCKKHSSLHVCNFVS